MVDNAPAGTRDYVYPALIEELEDDAIAKAEREANQGNITNPIVRDTLPSVDYDAGADASLNSGEEWGVTVASADTTIGDEIEIYDIDSDNGSADERVTAIYGFEAIENADFIDRVIFRGSDGQVFERAVIAGLDETEANPSDAQKALRSPISFGAQENGTISVVFNDNVDDTTDTTFQLKHLAVTAEKLGREIGTRNNAN